MRTFLFACGALLASFAACGGIAVVDPAADDGSGGRPATVTATNGTGGTMVRCALPGAECQSCGEGFCATELASCSELSSCDAAGNPESGCMALVGCVIVNCGDGSDIGCVLDNCESELSSTGGPGSTGTEAARLLGQCLSNNCAC